VCKDQARSNGFSPLIPFPPERKNTPLPYFHAVHLKQKIERSVPVALKNLATVTQEGKYPSAMYGARVFWGEKFLGETSYLPGFLSVVAEPRTNQ
jgi:hypothetical protein